MESLRRAHADYVVKESTWIGQGTALIVALGITIICRVNICANAAAEHLFVLHITALIAPNVVTMLTVQLPATRPLHQNQRLDHQNRRNQHRSLLGSPQGGLDLHGFQL